MLEQKLGKDLLYLACRHNVIESLSAAAYKTTMSAISEPEVFLVKGLKVQGESIDSMSYELEIVDKSVCSLILEETSHHMMQFASN